MSYNTYYVNQNTDGKWGWMQAGAARVEDEDRQKIILIRIAEAWG